MTDAGDREVVPKRFAFDAGSPSNAFAYLSLSDQAAANPPLA
jgi:hypothetical protein